VNQTAAMYMHPIQHESQVANIVAFLFVDENASGLNGNLQSRLSAVAPSLVASAL
jgi:hypothetical protein